MNLVDIVAVLAVLQYIGFGVLVGGARAKYGVKAPATSGAEGFERIHRVHMNTLELLVALLPGLYLWAKYWSPVVAAGLGAVYLVGRTVYWRAYVKEPGSRSLGYGLSAFPVMVLLVGGLFGAVKSLLG